VTCFHSVHERTSCVTSRPFVRSRAWRIEGGHREWAFRGIVGGGAALRCTGIVLQSSVTGREVAPLRELGPDLGDPFEDDPETAAAGQRRGDP